MSHKKDKQPEGLSWKALKGEWSTWYSGKHHVLWFGLKFGMLMAVFYGLLLIPGCERILYIYLETYAKLAHVVLNLCGQDNRLSEVTITSPKFSMAIRRGCDAVEPTWLFCAAVLSYPARLGHKAVGILTGIVVLQTLNLVRILSLYYIGSHFSSSTFQTVHLEIWPTVFIIAAILLMVGWIEWMRRHEHAS